MATATTSSISNVLKEFYNSPIVRQLNDELLLLSRVDAGSDEIIAGKYAVVPVSLGRNSGIGARYEGSTLAAAGSQSYTRAQYGLSYNYARINISGPSIAASSKDTGAFLRVLDSEIKGATIDLKKDIARQVYGNGDGSVATVGTGSSTTVVVLTSTEALDKGEIYIGMLVDIGTLANPTSRGASAVVSAITVATPSFTVSAVLGGGAPVNGEFVFRAGTTTNATTTAEMNGLGNMVSTTAGLTFPRTNTGGAGGPGASVGIDSTANPSWDNVRATTASLTQDSMLQLWARVRRASGDTPTLAVGSYGTRRQYFNLLQSQVRYVDTPTKLSAGFEAVDFNGLPLVADHEAPYGKLYMLNENHLKFYAINAQGGTDFAWMNLDGDTLLRVSGVDGYEAILHRYMNFGTDMRNSHGVLSGYTDTTGV
jgi:hypothetical protein